MLKGRAVIETLSKTGGEIVTKGTTLNYNFTTSQSQAYGDNMIIHGSKWCIYTGDVNQDGFVDFSDLGLIDNDSYNYVAGYVVTDLNGDQFVDFTDLGMCDNNSYNYIGTVKPPAKANTKPLTRNNLKWISN
jgi:hypothetical protein